MTNIKGRGQAPHNQNNINNKKRKINGEKTMSNNTKLTKTQISTLTKVHAALDAVKELSPKDKMKDYLINFLSSCEENALIGCLPNDFEYIVTLIFKKYVLKKRIHSCIQVCERLDDILEFRYLNLTNRCERYIKCINSHAPQSLINQGQDLIQNGVATIRIINYLSDLYFDGETAPEERLLMAVFGEKFN